MAELADARDLKSLDRKVVRVQSPLWAPNKNLIKSRKAQKALRDFSLSNIHTLM